MGRDNCHWLYLTYKVPARNDAGTAACRAGKQRQNAKIKETCSVARSALPSPSPSTPDPTTGWEGTSRARRLPAPNFCLASEGVGPSNPRVQILVHSALFYSPSFQSSAPSSRILSTCFSRSSCHSLNRVLCSIHSFFLYKKNQHT